MLLGAIIGTGCGFGPPSLSGHPAATLVGTDSAGATVEIEQRGGEFVRARVTDIVLGTGSADILFMNDDEFSFTIDFPAGARITYSGVHGGSVGGSGPESIEGTWTQDAGGLFGEDQGTWKVSG